MSTGRRQRSVDISSLSDVESTQNTIGSNPNLISHILASQNKASLLFNSSLFLNIKEVNYSYICIDNYPVSEWKKITPY